MGSRASDAPQVPRPGVAFSETQIVEVDEDFNAYEKGHITNAVSINWSSDSNSGWVGS